VEGQGGIRKARRGVDFPVRISECFRELPGVTLSHNG
jgi:hypothetical protein